MRIEANTSATLRMTLVESWILEIFSKYVLDFNMMIDYFLSICENFGSRSKVFRGAFLASLRKIIKI